MVSFSCEVCNDTVIKKRLQQHQRSCRGSYFTCIDCSTTFYGNDHQQHTSCISEAEKYEKALYKGPKKGKQQQQKQQRVQEAKPKEQPKDQSKKLEVPIPSKTPVDLKKYVNKDETSLYKVFKAVKKNNKKLSEKSDFLKALKVKQSEDGSFVISL